MIQEGNLVDVVAREIFPAKISIEDGKIISVERSEKTYSRYLMPGFVDAHVHIESSMVLPTEFSKVAMRHGTVGCASDPHEIANVLGKRGVEYMIHDAEKTPMKILFGAPSCVPATSMESAGAVLSASDISGLFERGDVRFLSEVMNYPGVINGSSEILEKIALAKKYQLPVDGHAPGVRGVELKRYAMAGISTDHECFTIEEAREKISEGMLIQIREGSGAKNFEALCGLLDEAPDRVMFCTDDLHPDDLIAGHINSIVKRALKKGFNLFHVLRAANYNAIKHYRMDVGLLQVGDPADFIVTTSPENLEILETYIEGVLVADKEKALLENARSGSINEFQEYSITEKEIAVPDKHCRVKIIEAEDGSLITGVTYDHPTRKDGKLVSDTGKDILKIVVVNRYQQAPPAVGFIRGFGLKEGAIASSIAHDSHNVIAVGVDDASIVTALNWISDQQGGIVSVSDQGAEGLPLPVAGIMTDQSVASAAMSYRKASAMANAMGSTLQAPFMTLAFMALLVIPELKMSDLGLFDGKQFKLVSLYAD